MCVRPGEVRGPMRVWVWLGSLDWRWFEFVAGNCFLVAEFIQFSFIFEFLCEIYIFWSFVRCRYFLARFVLNVIVRH